MTTHLTALPRIAMRRECFIRRFLVLFSAFTPLAVPGQVQVTNFVRGSNAVTFVSRVGYCPYLVRTSTNLFNWSDHGDLEVRTNWTLSAFASRSFYRVSDLNASNLYAVCLDQSKPIRVSSARSWLDTASKPGCGSSKPRALRRPPTPTR